jgi:hypothetical protein
MRRKNPALHQWVKNNVKPHKHFDVNNGKETFKQEKQEFLKPYISSTSTAQHTQDVTMSVMPSLMDHTNEAKPFEKVSTIKAFRQSCVKLLNDP